MMKYSFDGRWSHKQFDEAVRRRYFVDEATVRKKQENDTANFEKGQKEQKKDREELKLKKEMQAWRLRAGLRRRRAGRE